MPGRAPLCQDLDGYLPATFVLRGDRLRVRWLRCPPSELREPFLGQTEDRLITQALQGTVLETGVEALGCQNVDDLPQARGFIFHTSYCGSTLLSNMLTAIPGHLMLSEPGAISTLLEGVGDRLGNDLTPYLPTLRSTFQATARWMVGSAERYFVKFFSQSVHQVELLRLAMPAVPEIFLYRDPLEVVVANLRDPTQSWIWLQKYTGLPLDQALERPVAELFARGVGRTMEAMLEHLRPSTLLINYTEIGPSTPRLLLEVFGIPISERLEREMASHLSYDAKDVLRAKLFQRDVEQKRRAATSKVRDLVTQFAEPAFRELEARREASRAGSPAGSDISDVQLNSTNASSHLVPSLTTFSGD